MNNKKFRPTSYIVKFWNQDGTEEINEEIFPIYKYSFDDVTATLKGKEGTCDIYEGRYWKDRGEYITTGNTYVWTECGWTKQM